MYVPRIRIKTNIFKVSEISDNILASVTSSILVEYEKYLTYRCVEMEMDSGLSGGEHKSV